MILGEENEKYGNSISKLLNQGKATAIKDDSVKALVFVKINHWLTI
jgi:hypothetical protein